MTQALLKSEPAMQYAALPYRRTADGMLEVLLVTSLQTRRWIIPKGWPVKGMGPAGSAAREAYEEAGVVGTIAMEPLGSYKYDKLREKKGCIVACDVLVFPLRVEAQLSEWPEAGARELRWVGLGDAADLVSDEGLGVLLRQTLHQPAAWDQTT